MPEQPLQPEACCSILSGRSKFNSAFLWYTSDQNASSDKKKFVLKFARIVSSGRIGHAYFADRTTWSWEKKRLALAFAEAVNGVENLSELGDRKSSAKSSWFVHPDIHLFIPVPKSGLLPQSSPADCSSWPMDPYAIVDFASRPSLGRFI